MNFHFKITIFSQIDKDVMLNNVHSLDNFYTNNSLWQLIAYLKLQDRHN